MDHLAHFSIRSIWLLFFQKFPEWRNPRGHTLKKRKPSELKRSQGVRRSHTGCCSFFPWTPAASSSSSSSSSVPLLSSHRDRAEPRWLSWWSLMLIKMLLLPLLAAQEEIITICVMHRKLHTHTHTHVYMDKPAAALNVTWHTAWSLSWMIDGTVLDLSAGAKDFISPRRDWDLKPLTFLVVRQHGWTQFPLCCT